MALKWGDMDFVHQLPSFPSLSLVRHIDGFYWFRWASCPVRQGSFGKGRDPSIRLVRLFFPLFMQPVDVFFPFCPNFRIWLFAPG